MLIKDEVVLNLAEATDDLRNSESWLTAAEAGLITGNQDADEAEDALEEYEEAWEDWRQCKDDFAYADDLYNYHVRKQIKMLNIWVEVS